jgi:hypothetical protein
LNKTPFEVLPARPGAAERPRRRACRAPSCTTTGMRDWGRMVQPGRFPRDQKAAESTTPAEESHDSAGAPNLAVRGRRGILSYFPARP